MSKLMTKRPVPTWCFALVVVRRGNQFLIVQEAKHQQRWYLPAGRLEPGETFEEAALRETWEEAGLPVVLKGVIRIEHSVREDAARQRVIFLAEPMGEASPKGTPDHDSLQAKWVTLDELQDYPLRGGEVTRLFQYLDAGGAVYPLGLLQPEGLPFDGA